MVFVARFVRLIFLAIFIAGPDTSMRSRPSRRYRTRRTRAERLCCCCTCRCCCCRTDLSARACCRVRELAGTGSTARAMRVVFGGGMAGMEKQGCGSTLQSCTEGRNEGAEESRKG
ncbi:hypothetical protein V8E36_002710 [Tilletia maclaganii]